MAIRRSRGHGGPFTAEAVVGLDYAGLVAAWADADVRWSGPDPDCEKFPASRSEYGAIVARLEVLAASDPRIVERVQRVANRRWSERIGGHQPGDLSQAEGAMCLAAWRHATYLTDDGPRDRGPFAQPAGTPPAPQARRTINDR